MMDPMQSGSKFTDRIIKYLTESAERKTTRASKSKGHVISYFESISSQRCGFGQQLNYHDLGYLAGDIYGDGGRKTLTFWIRMAIKSQTNVCKC